MRGSLGAAGVIAGGAAIGVGSRDGISFAAPTEETDAEILKLFLSLEYVQEGFYREVVRRSSLASELREFATVVGRQESEHVEFLAARLGAKAGQRPQSDFGESTESDEGVRRAAIELEEAAVAAYIGQSPNLTARTMRAVATLVSVEARQAAWVRNLDGVSPAPHAADPGRKPDEILSDLRKQGFLR